MSLLIRTTTLLLLVSLVFTSCNTILRSRNQQINVFTNTSNAKVIINDSVYMLPAKIKVKRSKDSLKISLLTDTTTPKDTILIPKVGDLFSAGNIPTIPLLGAGYWIDLTNDKRFAYPKNIFFNTIDNLDEVAYRTSRYIAKYNIVDETKQAKIFDKYKNLKAIDDGIKNRIDKRNNYRFNPKEGRVRFNLLIPSIYHNGISNQNPDVDEFKLQMVGFSFGIGFDYFYKNNRFLTLDSSVKSSSIVWWNIPDSNPIKYDISLRKGHRINRIEYSYGLTFNYIDYYYSLPQIEYRQTQPFFSDDNKSEHYEKYQSIGFTTLINYQLTSALYVGFRYDPSVFSFRKSGAKFNYEHVFGLDLRFKF